MTINTSVNPYYDDFDESKDFHQILYKPGYAVQARELTQSQSILRNQIAKFGGHVFTQGSLVIPGNSNSDLTICYVKLQSTTVSLSALEGMEIIGAVTGLRGKIKKGINAVNADPDTLYVSYYNTGNLGDQVFRNNETLNVVGSSVTFVTASSAPCGGAAIAYINKGVFFVNGTFVNVSSQSAIISKYSNVPSCHVLLKITEEIVDSTTDSSLLDPAQGSYNYAAPGADRLKISLTLTVLDLGSAVTDDYIEIMRYNEGVLEEHLTHSKYNELEKNLARRTYDESGDYVVMGLEVTAREHLRSTVNNGRYDAPLGDETKFIYTVNGGRAYIRGFENEVFSSREYIVPKARTSDHIKTDIINMVPSYGQAIYVTNLSKLPNFNTFEQINIYNSDTAGVIIGTANVLAIDYVEPNTTDVNAIYKLYISNINIDASLGKMADIGRFVGVTSACSGLILHKFAMTMYTDINYTLGETVTSGTGSNKVHKYIRGNAELYAYKNGTAASCVFGDIITGGTSASVGKIMGETHSISGVRSNLLMPVPIQTPYRLKNELNAVDLSYKGYYYTTVLCNGAGVGSFSVTGMTIDPKEQGNFSIITSAGAQPLSYATISGDGFTVNLSGSGLISTTAYVVCAITKVGAGAAPKTKTIVTSYTQTGLTPASTVMLDKADGVRLLSVTSTTDGDVTKSFTFNNGQEDYIYNLAYLTLKSGYATPGGTLTVVYDYFQHNAGAGDYFTVDSYESSGITNYYSTPLLNYYSKNSGKVYDLRMTMDFRSRVGDDGTMTAGTASYSIPIQNDSRVTSSVQHYVPRIDAIIMDRSGEVKVLQGVPAKTPVSPKIPVESLQLASIGIPPFTFDVRDIRIFNIDNRGYTMRDINKISKRLKMLEDAVTLSMTQTAVVTTDIIDAQTGIARFKSAYLFDDFKNPDSTSDVNNSSFKVSYISNKIVPQFEVHESQAIIVSESVTRKTGNVYSLPYTEVVLAQQPTSSRITNINPFSVFIWVGTMILSPATDTWSETSNLAAAFETNVNIINETVEVRRPADWKPPVGANVTYEPNTTVIQTVPGNKVMLWYEEYDKLVKAGALTGSHWEAEPLMGKDEWHFVNQGGFDVALGTGVYANTVQSDWVTTRNNRGGWDVSLVK